MFREGLDVSGLSQVHEFGADCKSNLLANLSVDLPELAQGLRLPVDRIHGRIISEQYVFSMMKRHDCLSATPDVQGKPPALADQLDRRVRLNL